jgi:hypothetical protein
VSRTEPRYWPRKPAGAWSNLANCVGSKHHFPIDPPRTPGYNQDVAAAIAMCTACPVRQECLDHALANHEQEGVWGGYAFPLGVRAYKKRLALQIRERSYE